MSEWKEVAHFLYGKGFWYADPLWEIRGLTDEHLFWVPDPKSLCILWHVGHIAHRERTHIGRFLQGIQGTIIPPQYEVFGTEWCSTEKVRLSIGPAQSVLAWVRDVREKSHEYIMSLSEDDFHAVPPTSHEGLSVAHWLLITTGILLYTSGGFSFYVLSSKVNTKGHANHMHVMCIFGKSDIARIIVIEPAQNH